MNLHALRLRPTNSFIQTRLRKYMLTRNFNIQERELHIIRTCFEKKLGTNQLALSSHIHSCIY
jgi:hypothetical protein